MTCERAPFWGNACCKGVSCTQREEEIGMRTYRILGLICLYMILFTGARVSRAQASSSLIFYVSTEGSDAWSGKYPEPNVTRTDGPFASLIAARNAVRKLKEVGSLTQPVTIYLRAGTYQLTDTLVFSDLDSGSPKAPITYARYREEMPVLSGGKVIRGWRKFGELWQAEVPEVREGKWYFRQLFVNGQRRQRARSPNAGYFQVDGGIVQSNRLEFTFRGEDIKPEWAGRSDVELIMPRAWTVVRYHIVTVNPSTHRATLSGEDVHYVDEKDARYWVENFKDALDSPGEWYLDGRAGIVYYKPLPGEDIEKIQVVAPLLHQLIRFEGDTWGKRNAGGSAFAFSPVHDIRLRGLTFSYADWTMPPDGLTDFQGGFNLAGALEASSAASISIENSTFSHLGEFAIDLGKACRDVRIVGNEIQDLGGGAIKIGEPKVENNDYESTGNNTISDNKIHDLGIVDPGADAIWVGETGDNRIVHNEIYNTRHSGIAVGWTWGYHPTSARANLIAFNHLHHIGLGATGDFGCVYTLGAQPGTIIRNNLCHDVSRSETSYGGWGIYTDEGSSDLLIENNIVYRTQDAGFHHHYGQNNVIHNNIFAMGELSQLRRTQNEAGNSFDFQHNILYWNRGGLFDGEWTDYDFHFDNNIYFYFGQKAANEFAGQSFDEWQRHGQDLHSVIADPLFVNPALGNFSLLPHSPALSLGFEPIDMSTVGPRDSVWEGKQ